MTQQTKLERSYEMLNIMSDIIVPKLSYKMLPMYIIRECEGYKVIVLYVSNNV